MKKISAIAIMTAIIIMLPSCRKDNTIMYGNTTMGDMVDGRFISDNGHLFRIVEQNCSGNMEGMKRVYTIGDILRKTIGGQENEYDVRLDYIYEPVCKEILNSSDIHDYTELGDDPVRLESCWFSGGYINLIISIEYDGTSGKAHLVNLVKDDEKSTSGTLYFQLRHNACGETAADGGHGSISITNDLMTFPFARLVTDTSSETEVVIYWKWFDENGNIKESSTCGTYRKGGFEQASARPLTFERQAVLK